MFFFSAGKAHIEHLHDKATGSDDDSLRIQINRMDIYDAKIVTL